MLSTCPCCGQPAERIPDHILDQLPLAPQQRTIVSILARRFGRFVENEVIIAAMYENDPNGGAEWANHCLSKAVCRIRQLLGGTGIRLENSQESGCRGAYRLRWEDQESRAA